MQRWVSTVNVCSLCVYLLYVCICGCFVNGVCVHGLAVVEAHRDLLELLFNWRRNIAVVLFATAVPLYV